MYEAEKKLKTRGENKRSFLGKLEWLENYFSFLCCERKKSFIFYNKATRSEKQFYLTQVNSILFLLLHCDMTPYIHIVGTLNFIDSIRTFQFFKRQHHVQIFQYHFNFIRVNEVRISSTLKNDMNWIPTLDFGTQLKCAKSD